MHTLQNFWSSWIVKNSKKESLREEEEERERERERNSIFQHFLFSPNHPPSLNLVRRPGGRSSIFL
jgi:hypothetical protein